MRPVDLQDNFSKAPLAAREQHIQQTRADQAQYQATEQQGKTHAADQRRVKANKNVETTRMNSEQNKRHEGKKEKSGGRESNLGKKSTKNAAIKYQTGKGQLLDLTI